jgi:hypothetical protein
VSANTDRPIRGQTSKGVLFFGIHSMKYRLLYNRHIASFLEILSIFQFSTVLRSCRIRIIIYLNF